MNSKNKLKDKRFLHTQLQTFANSIEKEFQLNDIQKHFSQVIEDFCCFEIETYNDLFYALSTKIPEKIIPHFKMLMENLEIPTLGTLSQFKDFFRALSLEDPECGRKTDDLLIHLKPIANPEYILKVAHMTFGKKEKRFEEFKHILQKVCNDKPHENIVEKYGGDGFCLFIGEDETGHGYYQGGIDDKENDLEEEELEDLNEKINNERIQQQKDDDERLLNEAFGNYKENENDDQQPRKSIRAIPSLLKEQKEMKKNQLQKKKSFSSKRKEKESSSTEFSIESEMEIEHQQLSTNKTNDSLNQNDETESDESILNELPKKQPSKMSINEMKETRKSGELKEIKMIEENVSKVSNSFDLETLDLNKSNSKTQSISTNYSDNKNKMEELPLNNENDMNEINTNENELMNIIQRISTKLQNDYILPDNETNRELLQLLSSKISFVHLNPLQSFN